MFARVLFATDLSLASERVVDCLGTWKALGLSQVVVAHVHHIRHTGGLELELRRDHEPKLAAQAARLRAAGIDGSWRLAFGVPYLDIDRIAHEEGAEAIVIGSHGQTWLSEVWLGSVADAILRHSTLPVMVVKVNRLVTFPAPECDRFCGSLFSKVLYATDFSDSAEFALEAVTRCVSRTKAAARLVHVQDVGRIRPHLEDQLQRFNEVDTQRLARIGEALCRAGASEVTHEIRFDHVARGILHAIEEWQPNLVVLGNQGRGYVPEILLGGTAHQIARLSPAPVLLVPTPRERWG